MADVKSYRVSDPTHEELQALSKSQSSMDETFRMLLATYKESTVKRNAINSARLQEISSLCNQICSTFQVVLDGQATEIEKVRCQNNEDLEKLRQLVDGKNQELKQYQERAEAAETALKAVQAENDTLKELNEALKGKNEALDRTLGLLNEKVNAEPKKLVKKTMSKKVETEPVKEKNV